MSRDAGSGGQRRADETSTVERAAVTTGRGVAVAGARCGVHGHVMQSGGQRPSGPSSGQRSVQRAPKAIVARKTSWQATRDTARSRERIECG